jgi:hypothetical protein
MRNEYENNKESYISTIEIKTLDDNSVEVIKEKEKLTFMSIYNILFLLFILSCVGYWSSIAGQMSFLFIIFSIPFWLVASETLFGVVVNLTEKQKINISENTLRLEKEKFGKIKTYEIALSSIESINLESIKLNIFTQLKRYRYTYLCTMNKRVRIKMPIIISNSESVTFFEFLEDEDKEFVVKALTKVLVNNHCK